MFGDARAMGLGHLDTLRNGNRLHVVALAEEVEFGEPDVSLVHALSVEAVNMVSVVRFNLPLALRWIVLVQLRIV